MSSGGPEEPLRIMSPDSVLEPRQEAGGDAESRVQKVFLFRRLQVLQVGVKFLCAVKEASAFSVL